MPETSPLLTFLFSTKYSILITYHFGSSAPGLPGSRKLPKVTTKMGDPGRWMGTGSVRSGGRQARGFRPKSQGPILNRHQEAPWFVQKAGLPPERDSQGSARCTPQFLRLANEDREVWVEDSAPHLLKCTGGFSGNSF